MRKAGFICCGLMALVILVMPVASHAQVAVGISIRVGPPPLPVYVQPPVPGPGYIWTPGYWAYGPDGYYWVPGTWVEPPAVGLLWTPGYWGWREGFYVWSPGYWGPHVGFYGGINYGFGYTGVGFVGGYWRGGVFSYNRAVTNVNTTIIHNTYNTTVINNNTTINRTSFNGGQGGIHAQPTAVERAAMNERHISPTGLQAHHEQGARSNRALLASVNHGSPSIAASPKAGVFNGQGVVAARNANFNRGGANNSMAYKPGGNGSNNGFKGNASSTYKGTGSNNPRWNNNAYSTSKGPGVSNPKWNNNAYNGAGSNNRNWNGATNNSYKGNSSGPTMPNTSRNQGHNPAQSNGNERRDHR